MIGLQEKRKALQEELNKVMRMKTVAIITDNEEEMKEADLKRETLIMAIEEIDEKIKTLKQELRDKIRGAQEELVDVLANQLKIDDELKVLKDQYIEEGSKKILIEIEAKNNIRKEFIAKGKELQEIITTSAQEEESKEETTEEVYESRVNRFIKKEVEEGKSYNEIAEKLNKMMSSSLDEYVESDEFNNMYTLFINFHYVSNDGSISYRPILDLGDSVESGNNLDSSIKDNINKINELIPKANEILELENDVNTNFEPDKYIKYRDQYASIISEVRDLEAKCIDVMCNILKKKYQELIGDRIVDEDGNDYTTWADENADNSLHEAVVDLMLKQFVGRTSSLIFSKGELQIVGEVGNITAEDVASFIAGSQEDVEVSDNEDNETDELMAMFTDTSVENVYQNENQKTI